ncbi:MAG: YihY/virulence factor BrkB family protein, partial [Bacteroidetes bacterium]|nr:YihY/virulence factor BrkB family protein [Bacteroidota bacterium]
GGILAGTTYVLIQYVYINFQVGVSRQNAIYGSFAALPLFLIWMQLSWLITLIGAKISFAYQNVEMFEFEKDSIEMSQAFKRRITLIVAHLLVKNFTEGKKSMTVSDLSHELQIPFRMVYRVTRELVDCNIISETAVEDRKDPGFQPAQDTNHLSVQFVLQTLEDKGFNSIELDHIKDSDKINATLDSFKSILSETSANKLLKDL